MKGGHSGDDAERGHAPLADVARLVREAVMTQAPESPGVLVVRAWHEQDGNRFVARITSITDLVNAREDVAPVSSSGDVVAVVRKWLDEVSKG